MSVEILLKHQMKTLKQDCYMSVRASSPSQQLYLLPTDSAPQPQEIDKTSSLFQHCIQSSAGQYGFAMVGGICAGLSGIAINLVVIKTSLPTGVNPEQWLLTGAKITFEATAVMAIALTLAMLKLRRDSLKSEELGNTRKVREIESKMHRIELLAVGLTACTVTNIFFEMLIIKSLLELS